MFKLYTIMLCAALLAFGFPAQAQAPSLWVAWLYDSTTGTITQVSDTGEIVGTNALPLPQAFNTYGETAVVSPSGRYVAYTAFDSTLMQPNTTLFIVDLQLSIVVMTYDLSQATVTSLDVLPSTLAFDEAGLQFAIGYQTEAGWELGLLDFNATAAAQTITAADVDAPPANTLPVVRRVEAGQVDFTALPDENAVTGTSYTWDSAAGTITPNAGYPPLIGDRVAASGEAAFPSSSEDFPGEGMNLITIAADGEQFPFYNETNGEIEAVYFIQNGERLLAQVAEGDETVLKVINRDGTIAGELVGLLDDLNGVANGFVGMFDTTDGSRALAYLDTRGTDYTPVTVWTGGIGVAEELIYIQSNVQPSLDLPAWTRLQPGG